MGCAASFPKKDSDDGFFQVKKHTAKSNKNVSNSNKSSGHNNGVIPPQAEKENAVLRGDVVKKYEARVERDRILKEKQKKVALAAEVMSAQVLEEKERLSLTSRSRATSRATSRTASPTFGSTSKRDKHLQESVLEAPSEGSSSRVNIDSQITS